MRNKRRQQHSIGNDPVFKAFKLKIEFGFDEGWGELRDEITKTLKDKSRDADEFAKNNPEGRMVIDPVDVSVPCQTFLDTFGVEIKVWFCDVEGNPRRSTDHEPTEDRLT